jgi:hypothetical protein
MVMRKVRQALQQLIQWISPNSVYLKLFGYILRYVHQPYQTCACLWCHASVLVWCQQVPGDDVEALADDVRHNTVGNAILLQ